MDDYESLLDRARDSVPEDAFKRSGERFQVPNAQIIVQGNRSIWQNFQEIITILNRPGKEVLKYVSGQLATAGNIEGGGALFQGKFSSEGGSEHIDSTCLKEDNSICHRYTYVYVKHTTM
jgi:translation initiation factor 2 subunit 2